MNIDGGRRRKQLSLGVTGVGLRQRLVLGISAEITGEPFHQIVFGFRGRHSSLERRYSVCDGGIDVAAVVVAPTEIGLILRILGVRHQHILVDVVSAGSCGKRNLGIVGIPLSAGDGDGVDILERGLPFLGVENSRREISARIGERDVLNGQRVNLDRAGRGSRNGIVAADEILDDDLVVLRHLGLESVRFDGNGIGVIYAEIRFCGATVRKRESHGISRIAAAERDTGIKRRLSRRTLDQHFGFVAGKLDRLVAVARYLDGYFAVDGSNYRGEIVFVAGFFSSGVVAAVIEGDYVARRIEREGDVGVDETVVADHVLVDPVGRVRPSRSVTVRVVVVGGAYLPAYTRRVDLHIVDKRRLRLYVARHVGNVNHKRVIARLADNFRSAERLSIGEIVRLFGADLDRHRPRRSIVRKVDVGCGVRYGNGKRRPGGYLAEVLGRSGGCAGEREEGISDVEIVNPSRPRVGSGLAVDGGGGNSRRVPRRRRQLSQIGRAVCGRTAADVRTGGRREINAADLYSNVGAVIIPVERGAVVVKRKRVYTVRSKVNPYRRFGTRIGYLVYLHAEQTVARIGAASRRRRPRRRDGDSAHGQRRALDTVIERRAGCAAVADIHRHQLVVRKPVLGSRNGPRHHAEFVISVGLAVVVSASIVGVGAFHLTFARGNCESVEIVAFHINVCKRGTGAVGSGALGDLKSQIMTVSSDTRRLVPAGFASERDVQHRLTL